MHLFYHEMRTPIVDTFSKFVWNLGDKKRNIFGANFHFKVTKCPKRLIAVVLNKTLSGFKLMFLKIVKRV